MNETVRPRTRGELLDAWRRHLTLQRGLSEHTARAYVGDVGDLLSFLGVGDDGTEPVGPALASLDLADLRDWLARMSTSGRARATIARRAAAAKAFSTWAHRLALLPADAAARLRSPRADNRLPAVLTEDQAAALLTAAAHRAREAAASGEAAAARAVALRDVALLEVLYATGVRVAELCGLDVDDIDRSRRTLRVLGKGDKERTVPYGLPASRALEDWLAVRANLVSDAAGRALFVGVRGRRLNPRAVRGAVHRAAALAGVADLGPHDAALHPCVGRAAAGRLRSGLPPGLTGPHRRWAHRPPSGLSRMTTGCRRRSGSM